MPNRPPTDTDLFPTVLRRREAIAARVGETTDSGCWLWAGALTGSGYGTYSVGVGNYQTRSLRAHRAVFMLHHGRPIADGMTLHHVCHNPVCVNPDHLVEMTQEANLSMDATGGGSIRFRATKQGVPRWSVLFRENGKQRSRVFGSLDEAEAFAESRKAAVAA